MTEQRLITREQLGEVYELGKRHERALMVGCLRVLGLDEAADTIETGSKAPKTPLVHMTAADGHQRSLEDVLDASKVKAMYEAAWEKGAKDAIGVENGKYTFVKFGRDYRVFILRYDEPWVVIEQGCNAVTALMNHVMELEGGR